MPLLPAVRRQSSHSLFCASLSLSIINVVVVLAHVFLIMIMIHFQQESRENLTKKIYYLQILEITWHMGPYREVVWMGEERERDMQREREDKRERENVEMWTQDSAFVGGLEF